MNTISLLDGAMGSELINRGELLPEHIWSAHANLTNPKLVYQIHKDYVKAGAQFLITNTFRTTPRSYKKTGLSNSSSKNKAKESLRSAIKCARMASNKNSILLGSIAPLEDCYKPKLFPGEKTALIEFMELGEWFANEGIDYFLLETMNSIIETKICLDSIINFDIPIWVSFHLSDPYHLLSGEHIFDAIDLIEDYPVECLLINCNTIYNTFYSVDNIVNKWNSKWGIYPNLGVGNPSPNGYIEKIHTNKKLISLMQKSIDYGASIIGGCCGSTPEHIAMLKKIFIGDN